MSTCQWIIYSMEVDFYLALFAVILVASSALLGATLVVATWKEALQVKKVLRRKSDLSDTLVVSFQCQRPSSTSNGEGKRLSEDACSQISTSNLSLLTADMVDEIYDKLPPQYIISPLGETDELRCTSIDEDYPQFCLLDRRVSQLRFSETRPRAESVSSEYNADRLFKLIFQDPVVRKSIFEANHEGDTSSNDKSFTALELVTTAMDTFQKVRSTLWTGKLSPIRQQQGTPMKFMTDRRLSLNVGPSVRHQGAKKYSDPGELSKFMETQGSSLVQPISFNMDDLRQMFRKESVISCHSPIGPEEAKYIQSKQKRKGAVTFVDEHMENK